MINKKYEKRLLLLTLCFFVFSYSSFAYGEETLLVQRIEHYKQIAKTIVLSLSGGYALYGLFTIVVGALTEKREIGRDFVRWLISLILIASANLLIRLFINQYTIIS